MAKVKFGVSVTVVALSLLSSTSAFAGYWDKPLAGQSCSSYYIIDKSKTCRSPHCQMYPAIQVVSALDYASNQNLGTAISCVSCDGVEESQQRNCVQKNIYYLNELTKGLQTKYASTDGVPKPGAMFADPTAMFWIGNSWKATDIARAMAITHGDAQMPESMDDKIRTLNSMYNISSAYLSNYVKSLDPAGRRGLRFSIMSSNYPFNDLRTEIIKIIFEDSLSETKVTREMLMTLESTRKLMFNMQGAYRFEHVRAPYYIRFIQQQQQDLKRLMVLSSDYQGMLKRDNLQDDVLNIIRKAKLESSTEKALIRSLQGQTDSQETVIEAFDSLIALRKRQLNDDTEKMLEVFRNQPAFFKSTGVMDAFIGVHNLQGDVVRISLQKASSAVMDPQYGSAAMLLIEDVAMVLNDSLKQVKSVVDGLEQLENGGSLLGFRDEVLSAVTEKGLAMDSAEIMDLAMQVGERIDRKESSQKMTILALSDEYKQIFNSFVLSENDQQAVLSNLRKAAARAVPAAPQAVAIVFNQQTLDPTPESLQKLWNPPQTPGSGSGSGAGRSAGSR